MLCMCLSMETHTGLDFYLSATLTDLGEWFDAFDELTAGRREGGLNG